MKRKLIAALVAAAFAGAQARGAVHAIILDKNLQFDPAGTAITVTAVSTNVLDMLAQRDMALGEQFAMKVLVTVLVALTSGGATTLQVQLQGSVDNAAWAVLAQTDAIPKANLAAGQTIEVPLTQQAPQSAGIPRYYRLNYVVATGPFTAGTVEADLVVSGAQDSNPPTYPPGVVVSN